MPVLGSTTQRRNVGRCCGRAMWIGLGAFFWGLAVAQSPIEASAQDVPFNPRYDGISERKTKSVTPTPDQGEKHSTIYSFARFSQLFKVLCEGLEADRRRERIFEIATVGLREEVSCASCRAFYRQMVQSCAAPRQKKPPATPTASAPTAELSDVGAEEQQQLTPIPAPTPSPIPQPGRYPRTEVVDAVSRLSDGLYEMEPGEGAPFQAVRAFASRVEALKDLTPGERDYFGVLLSYLLSAWNGREQELLTPKPLTRDDIADLFQ